MTQATFRSQVRAIYGKEMRDMLRDRRTLIAVFSFIIGTPLLAFFIGFLVTLNKGADSPPMAMLVGADLMPGLEQHLVNQGFAVERRARADDNGQGGAASIPDSLPEGVHALVRIPADAPVTIRGGQRLDIPVYVDEGAREGLEKGRRIMSAIQQYGSLMARHRLIARGVPAGLGQPLNPVAGDVASESLINRFIARAMVLLFFVAPFSAAMSVALDTLAGERERKSLQSLLAQPVAPRALVSGKFLMVLSFGFVGSALSAALLIAAMALAPDAAAAVLPPVSFAVLPPIILQLLPLSAFVAALLMAVSISVKSFKEGQSYMGMIMVLPLVAGYIKLYANDKLPDVVHMLPLFADMESLNRLILTGSASWTHVGVAIIASTLGAVLALGYTVRRLSSERLLDGD
ncbi:ABC transporter permease [Yunchengibacter salinarum]|uniref:ABC transporter permease n=1 Tax=Yunchengibacter salinarum TaxID=3133399 RepID=UPI0035B5D690